MRTTINGLHTRRGRTIRTGLLLIVTALGLLAVAAPPAAATVGAGVSAAPEEVSHPLSAGTSTHLPGWWVENTGSEAATYHLAVSAHTRQSEKPLPANWVGQLPSVTLAPGAHTVVPVTVSVPKRATGGHYAAYLVATAAPVATTGGLSAAAGAATDIRVQVTGSGAGFPLGLVAPAATGMVVAGGVGLVLRRRHARRAVQA